MITAKEARESTNNISNIKLQNLLLIIEKEIHDQIESGDYECCISNDYIIYNSKILDKLKLLGYKTKIISDKTKNDRFENEKLLISWKD